MISPWVGGKSKLAQEIISYFPPHKRYVEPFFGMGSVFFAKRESHESIINDINADLVNLFEVVRDIPHELIRKCLYTPRHEGQYDKFLITYQDKELYNKLDKVTRALIYYFLLKFSFNNMMTGSFAVNAGNSWGSDGLLENIEYASRRLQSTIILCRDYKDVIPTFANSDSVVYLDPPYAVTLEGGKGYYQHVLNRSQHEELATLLTNPLLDWKWVLSYDVHPLVEELYGGKEHILLFKSSEVFQSSIVKHSRFVKEDTYETSFTQEYIITNFEPIREITLFSGTK